jgi:hypothetical protein
MDGWSGYVNRRLFGDHAEPRFPSFRGYFPFRRILVRDVATLSCTESSRYHIYLNIHNGCPSLLHRA